MENKEILLKANALVTEGHNEGFLLFCTDDVTWEFIGDRKLQGKEAVRRHMAEVYVQPPEFEVEDVIAEADFVTVTGKISLKNEQGKIVDYAYCDVWKFRHGKMAELKAFVIEVKPR
jgi:ketosteroid isomerase-like protein